MGSAEQISQINRCGTIRKDLLAGLSQIICMIHFMTFDAELARLENEAYRLVVSAKSLKEMVPGGSLEP